MSLFYLRKIFSLGKILPDRKKNSVSSLSTPTVTKMPPKRKFEGETNVQAAKRQRKELTKLDIQRREQFNTRFNQKYSSLVTRHQENQKSFSNYRLNDGHLILALVFKYGVDTQDGGFYPIKWRQNLVVAHAEKLMEIEEDYQTALHRCWNSDEYTPGDEDSIILLFSDDKIVQGRHTLQKEAELPQLWKNMIAKPHRFDL